MVIYTLNGLLPEFNPIATVIRARDSPITIEELHDKLVDFEGVLAQANTQDNPIAVNTAIKNGQNMK